MGEREVEGRGAGEERGKEEGAQRIKSQAVLSERDSASTTFTEYK